MSGMGIVGSDKPGGTLTTEVFPWISGVFGFSEVGVSGRSVVIVGGEESGGDGSGGEDAGGGTVPIRFNKS